MPDLRRLHGGRLVPGLALVAAATLLVWWVAPLIPAVSSLLIAIVLGAIIGNGVAAWVRKAPSAREARWDLFRPGIAVAARRLLRIGVALLGLRLSLRDMLALGWRGLTVVIVTMAATFAVTLLAGRRMRVDRDATMLLATGFTVCGASAISAMTGVLEQHKGQWAGLQREGQQGEGQQGEAESRPLTDALGLALAMVTAYGTIAIFALPPLARLIGLDDAQAGLWIGASVQEVAQVVAAAGAFSAGALAMATVAKLARVVLLAPIIAGVGVVLARQARRHARVVGGDVAGVPDGAAACGGGTASGNDTVSAPAAALGRRPVPVPLFVVMFLVAVVVRTTGILPDTVISFATQATTALFIASMFALGLGIDVPRLLRAGRKAFLLGALAAVVATGVALAGVLLIVP
ncbi:MAG: putative sulfate exporter family transporter [Cellulomonadaceae bacterium]|jgi:uncharacterized membrane protein YadS|nr:putative sulfate exporter family transporter [Cellulomonadaceae bacterium]